jgi:lipopolysaccharide/colanic/teichoic acid biosynthesis glycosyltransferase
MMAKRAFDIVLAGALLMLALPLLVLLVALVFAADRRSPLYRGLRVGRGDRDFAMLKLRTMRVNSDAAGGTSTARFDARVTSLGHFLRDWKLDELPQLWNVLRGEMSMVGPRPNTRRGGVDNYTAQERLLLTVRPGITDLASIVFSDEGRILEGASDPDLAYDRLIRPWKSRLGLAYIANRSLAADARIITLTAVSLFAKPIALAGVQSLLRRWDANPELRAVCRRQGPLKRADPPGLVA